jgi:hypothetical protein
LLSDFRRLALVRTEDFDPVDVAGDDADAPGSISSKVACSASSCICGLVGSLLKSAMKQPESQ